MSTLPTDFPNWIFFGFSHPTTKQKVGVYEIDAVTR